MRSPYYIGQRIQIQRKPFIVLGVRRYLGPAKNLANKLNAS